jgi:hypothetical protein
MIVLDISKQCIPGKNYVIFDSSNLSPKANLKSILDNRTVFFALSGHFTVIFKWMTTISLLVSTV